MKAKKESRHTALLYLGARWEWVDNALPLDLLPLGNRPGILAPGLVWMGVENLATSWDSIPRPSSQRQVAIPTTISRPILPRHRNYH